jgi:FKBP-type peptidyl-prolyl cis-trans isomerase SlpA
MPTEQGSVVAFKDGAGFDVPGVVAKILDDTIVVDFNHPLSGRDILFKALIIKVDEPDLDVLEVKL